jgi:hypothetical protein
LANITFVLLWFFLVSRAGDQKFAPSEASLDFISWAVGPREHTYFEMNQLEDTQ